MPHRIFHGDACFAYLNKIRSIPGICVREALYAHVIGLIIEKV